MTRVGDDGPEFIVAPTEPPSFKAIATTISLLPERYGCDVVWWGKHLGEDALWGVQRKELKDLLASINDGRIAKEVAQMRAGGIPLPIIFIEGAIRFDNNDNLIWNGWGQQFTRSQWKGMLWSLMAEGVYIDYTGSIADTVAMVRLFGKWSMKVKHTSIMRRPGPIGPWGHAQNEDFAVHLLQGFDVLGSERAKALIKHFGKVPLKWEVTEKQLMEVPGVGKKIATKLIQSLT